MPTAVDRADVEELLGRGAQLVEVLPASEFEEEHLPDAVHVPLRYVESEAPRALDAGRPVIVYCWDGL